MARTNTAPVIERPKTHEGANAWQHVTPEQRLRRSVLSCMLWEDEFYEEGKAVSARIAEAAEAVSVETLAAVTVEARAVFNLRHVPLLLLSVLARRARGSALVSETVAATIQRADELGEFLAVYAKANGVAPNAVKPKLSSQVKRGLALAFPKFDAYQLGKYDRASAIRLRDALFLCHAKPRDEQQSALWKSLIAGTLEAPDTWEVALSTGGDKKETFERLLRDGKLGYLALLRNLRNMDQAGCDPALVQEAILARKGARRVFPFRYVAAARAAVRYEPALDQALIAAIADMPTLPGVTVVLVDVSGSMDHPLSARSDLSRMDAAATLAAITPGNVRVFTFSNALVEVPPRRGMAGVDAVIRSQAHGGTYMGAAVAKVNEFPHDRLIVVTDEQSQDQVPPPVAKNAYLINVASARNGIGYGPWTHIDGFSERIFGFIHENECREE